MKQVGIVTLISVGAAAAAPAPRVPQTPATFATAKSVEQFGGCFVDAQDRSGSAWSYVPRSDGGTFSNAGAQGVAHPYYLAVYDRGSTRQLRLEAASTGAPFDARVAKAVDQCI